MRVMAVLISHNNTKALRFRSLTFIMLACMRPCGLGYHLSHCVAKVMVRVDSDKTRSMILHPAVCTCN